MSAQTKKAFTIIEVMLFLAVTGALTVGILVGSGVAIGQQRYRDSVNSFKGHIQEQYGLVANVINSGPKNPECLNSGDDLIFDYEDTSLEARGTSECLVMGRFMLVEPDQVTTHNLIGRPGGGVASEGGDSATLRQYRLSLALNEPETREIAWGAQIVRPGSSDGMTASVLVVRSPLTGSIVTYVKDGDSTSSITDMIADDNMTQKDFCVNSGGMAGVRNQMAVRINARASSQSAVEIPAESDNVCS